jgi:hypothetical protein
MPVTIQLRNDTAANWTAANPILAMGEFGYETDTKTHKVGDGVTPWKSLAYYGVGPQGAAGTAGGAGRVVLNFGALPGSNEASVVVSSPTVLTTSIPTSEVAAVATSDHTISDHTYAALFMQLTCGAPTAGVGFTIYARSTEKLSGTFNVNWSWV